MNGALIPAGTCSVISEIKSMLESWPYIVSFINCPAWFIVSSIMAGSRVHTGFLGGWRDLVWVAEALVGALPPHEDREMGAWRVMREHLASQALTGDPAFF